MDWCNGRMLDKLDELGLTDNTLVYFSSDNGGHLEEYNEVKQQVEGGHNGIFRGKIDVWLTARFTKPPALLFPTLTGTISLDWKNVYWW